jgi:hypothetical protein
MPYADWKEWATRRLEWLQGDLGPMFERFVERKWQDALNVAAAEPQPWGVEKERGAPLKAGMDRTSQASKGSGKASGAVMWLANSTPPPKSHSPAWETSNWRKCSVQPQTGCDGNHVALRCTKLRELAANERRKMLEKSRLCMYCLKHAAELECYGQGGHSKPRCAQPECGGKHAAGAHKLLGATDASDNLTMEEDHESDEEEGWWVNTVRIGEEVESPRESEVSRSEESEEREDRYYTSVCMRKDDSGLEDELGYYWDAPIPSDSDTQ